MKEYKVEYAKNVKTAEEVMNNLARDGWQVASTALWYKWSVGLVITFEREKSEDIK